MEANRNKNLGDGLRIFGVIYFIFSILGTIILIALSAPNSTRYESNPFLIVSGIVVFIQGCIILAILSALARILKQNVEILESSPGKSLKEIPGPVLK